MSVSFKSKALEANLSNTKQESIELKGPHKYLLSLSESCYGIQMSTGEFFKELYHKYPNYKDITCRIRKIALTDYWLYLREENPEKPLGVIQQIILELFDKPLSREDKKVLFSTMVEFTGILADKYRPSFNWLILKTLDKIDFLMDRDTQIVLSHSNSLSTNLSSLFKIPDFKDRFHDLYYLLCFKNIEYWKKSMAMDQFLEDRGSLFSIKSVKVLKNAVENLYNKYYDLLDKANGSEFLIKNIPLYSHIADFYRNLTDSLNTPQDKFHYLVHLLNTPAMELQKEYLMYDLNTILGIIFKEMDQEHVIPFLDAVFQVLKELNKTNKYSVLNCCRTIGIKLSEKDSFPLSQHFAKKTLELGFIRPEASFSKDEWVTCVDPAHIANIRSWLDIFSTDTAKYEMILAGLTVNLKLGGVIIFDTDLFQKDITKLLNTDIKASYKLAKHLCKLFPVYFNEIGAEGELRDVTTLIDEMSLRQDRLIHFLRKQVHSESNNSHIELTRQIFLLWAGKDKTLIKTLVPRDVYESIDLEGPYVQPVYRLIHDMAKNRKIDPEDLLSRGEKEIKEYSCLPGMKEDPNIKKLNMLCRLYNLLVEKYSFNTVDICRYLRKFSVPQEEKIDLLERYLKENRTEMALKTVYEMMEQLKGIIFSDKKTEGWENIYYKRHIAYGIPSMYGTYHEEKFESLGIIFKLEQLGKQLIRDLKNNINLSYITADTLQSILKVLQYYQRGLKMDGISINELDQYLEMFRYSLTSKSFSLKQYINMFRFISESIGIIIKNYFFKPYDYPLRVIIPQVYDCSNIKDQEIETLINCKSEEFYRDMLSNAFLLQGLDAFITEIITAMNDMVNNYSPEIIRDIMTFDKDMIISPFNIKTQKLDNHVFLGQKAYNLKKLYLLGYPVPPGFVISTEIFRRKNTILRHPELMTDIDKSVRHHINRLEKLTGKEYGNKNNPLLLSVRSGASITMPGAMNTFLNVGVNEEIIHNLSKQDNYAWTAWDCYRRFLQTWGMSYGIKRDAFDQIISGYKETYNIEMKAEFNPQQMRDIAFEYKNMIKNYNIYIEDDPFGQLRQTIINVFNSWDSELARTYRKILDIADEWGTAVIVQKMVLGNLNYTSGTGVVFTRADYASRPGINLNGDFTWVSQGEDIVGGLVNPLPVSPDQPYTKMPEHSLKNTFPGIYNRLNVICSELIGTHGFDHQEIEFTFESQNPDDLYILQVRDQNTGTDIDMNMFEYPVDDDNMLGKGIGIGDGVLNGIIIFDEIDMSEMKDLHPDKRLILARPDTVPDDIGLIYECDGLITSRGGSTSHAAVTAARLNKKCIVNTSGLRVDEQNKICWFGEKSLEKGDEIALDTKKGCIYKGNYATKRSK